MRLETERLILRQWRKDDLDEYAALMADPTVRRYYPSTLTRTEAEEQIDRHLAAQEENPFHFLAATSKADDAFVGMIGIAKVPDMIRQSIPIQPEVEIGWIINRQFWGKGLTPEGAQACLDHAWLLCLPEVVAFTARINLPSQRVMEKLGMVRDPAADYHHPLVPEDHPIRPHVLYRIANPGAFPG